MLKKNIAIVVLWQWTLCTLLLCASSHLPVSMQIRRIPIPAIAGHPDRQIHLRIAGADEEERHPFHAQQTHDVRQIRHVPVLHGQANGSPGIAADAQHRQRGHDDRVQPAEGHYFAGSSEVKSSVKVYGVGDGIPPFQCDDGESEDGQLAREDGQEAGYLAPGT